MPPADPDAWIAYLSMEIGLDPNIPTYAGGLGVLAGDTLRAAADLGVPMVAVSLVHRKGYFRQRLDPHGKQSEEPANWPLERYLEPAATKVSVELEGRTVWIRAWIHQVRGIAGHVVPVYLLDTALAENDAWAQSLTDNLYGGDLRYRLCQEAILGLGGESILRSLGHDIRVFHMNEGHSALLVLALLEEGLGDDPSTAEFPGARDAVRRQCVFTTHTPVPAGHDKFPLDLVRQVLGTKATELLQRTGGFVDQTLNMTNLALAFAHYTNGVAMRHCEISGGMFPGYPINSITNGVHAVTWTLPPIQALFDRHFPEWRRDNLYLRYAITLPPGEVLRAHAESKKLLFDEVTCRSGVRLDPAVFTLGFARRATAYKRFELLFRDLDRLRRIAKERGPLQIVCAGKAHPRDEGGKRMIGRVFEAAESLKGDVTVVYLEEYDMALARLLCGGVDVWLNTPQRPQEASGTSGMKAALNGVPSLSILDGWWVEGCLENVTGWAIADGDGVSDDAAIEAAALYGKLEFVVLPMYYRQPLAFAEIRRAAIALNGSFYNAQRMIAQYLHNAYRPQESA